MKLFGKKLQTYGILLLILLVNCEFINMSTKVNYASKKARAGLKMKKSKLLITLIFTLIK